jgi:hypothetical protein
MTLNPLGGHFAEGDGAAFLVDDGFFVVVAFLVGVADLVVVGLGELPTVGELLAVGEGAGDSVTARLCVGRREITSVIAKKSRFIDRSI